MNGRPAKVAACASVVFALAVVALGAQHPERSRARVRTPPPAPVHRAPRHRAPDRVDVNRADATAFAALPGIGPATAARLVEAREARGGFRTIADVDAVKGIGPHTLERIRPYLIFPPDPSATGDHAAASVPDPPRNAPLRRVRRR